ncbi:hypothetical protein IGS68_35110 (plasmid) [Skermanella sp. TT6]|uniref:Uncharacterized protein n=1 Tax=Skermanella cutis TaxID=2775420 RepID=A0ABX7BI65_9PROT|nr:hypothetical protein [Skermanella sp. TT6]QQP94042.1 hypothetical protein IGS68_35110 [Skermanella sp. TT6]
MAEVVAFPEPNAVASNEFDGLADCWDGVESSACQIRKIISDAGSPDKLTDEQKFKLQLELEYMLHFVREDAFSGMLLSENEYKRRYNAYIYPKEA